MLFLKVILLFVYLVMLIAIYRIVDLVTWSKCDFSGDPFTLSIRQLRWILNSRGINFPLGVEKNDVSQLVDSTGVVTLEELNLAEDANLNQYSSVAVKNVEDFKNILHSDDQVWLIQIKPENNETIISETEWKKLTKKVEISGIKSGFVDCKESPEICNSYTFLSPQLLLTSRWNKKLNYISHRTDCSQAPSWMESKLKTEIPQIPSMEILERDWIKHHDLYPLQVIYVTPLNSVPLVFKQLLQQRNIRFGRMKRSTFNMSAIMTSQSAPESSFLLLITPEYIVTHERTLHYPQINLLLKSINPDVNFLFNLSVYFCNGLALLSFMTSQGNVLLRSCAVLKSMLFYNTLMLGGWLICSSYDVLFIKQIRSQIPPIVRRVAITTTAYNARTLLLRMIDHYYVVIIGFFLFFYVTLKVLERLNLFESENEEVLFPDILSNNEPSLNLSQRWVERLATPALWLKPLVPLDYIGELAVWEYKSRDRSQSFNRDVTSQSRGREAGLMISQRNRSSDNNVTSSLVRRGCDSDGTSSMARGLIKKIRSCLRGRSPKCRRINGPPDGMREEDSCSVCLDTYVSHVTVCGLPCGHVFHHECILSWLQSDQHCCPICRWPAFQQK